MWWNVDLRTDIKKARLLTGDWGTYVLKCAKYSRIDGRHNQGTYMTTKWPWTLIINKILLLNSQQIACFLSHKYWGAGQKYPNNTCLTYAYSSTTLWACMVFTRISYWAVGLPAGTVIESTDSNTYSKCLLEGTCRLLNGDLINVVDVSAETFLVS